MATGGGSFSYSVTEASDIIHDFPCSPCSENGHNSEAIYRCVECKTFLCAKCCDGHNQFVKGHKVVEARTKDIGGGSIHLKGYTCEEHPDKLIEMYCKTHDEIYCAVCILQHRSCTGVDYIPDIAKKLLENQDKESVETELKQQSVELQKLKHSRLKYLSKLSEDKDKHAQNIKRYKEDLIRKASEMEKSLLLEVEKKYQAMTDDVNLDVEKIDQLIDDVKKYLSKIVAGKYDDDKDEVITLKLSEHQVIAANKEILNLAWKKEENVDFQRSTMFKKWLGETRIGNFSVSRRSRDTVYIYNLIESNSKLKNIQSGLIKVGIHSKVIEDLGVVNAGDLCVCVVSRKPDLEKLVNDLNKKSRRYKVLIVCFIRQLDVITRYWEILSDSHSQILSTAVSRRLCTDNNLPYISIDDQQSMHVSEAVQLIKTTLGE